MRLRTTLTVLASVIVLGGVVAGAIAAVTGIPGEDGTITACYTVPKHPDKKSADKKAADKGDLRVVAEADQCAADESVLTWNQKGQQGESGATGPQGATGSQGPEGSMPLGVCPEGSFLAGYDAEGAVCRPPPSPVCPADMEREGSFCFDDEHRGGSWFTGVFDCGFRKLRMPSPSEAQTLFQRLRSDGVTEEMIFTADAVEMKGDNRRAVTFGLANQSIFIGVGDMLDNIGYRCVTDLGD